MGNFLMSDEGSRCDTPICPKHKVFFTKSFFIMMCFTGNVFFWKHVFTRSIITKIIPYLVSFFYKVV